MKRPTIAIVVPTGDQASDMFRACRARLDATTGGVDARIHVIQDSGPGFRFAKSINRGLEQSPDADGCILLNDDCHMDDGWIEAFLEAERAHPEVGLWGALLRYPDGRIQHAGGYIPLSPVSFFVTAAKDKAPLWALRRIVQRGGRLSPYMYKHYDQVGPNRLDFVTAACVYIPRTTLLAVGRYDEAYSFGNEDIDYSLRVRRAGLELGVAMRASGQHIEGFRTTGASWSPKKQASEDHFVRSWSGKEIRRLTRGRSGVTHPDACQHASGRTHLS